jgi:hypothetical protein
MNKSLIVFAILLLAAAAFLYFRPQSITEPVASTVEQESVAVTPREQPVAPPPAAPEPEEPLVPDAPPPPTVEEIPLPPLAESDPLAIGMIENLAGAGAPARFFAVDNLVSRLVATVDALGTRQVPGAIQAVQPPEGDFLAIAVSDPETVIRNEAGDEIAQFDMDPANADRYLPFVELLESMETEVLVDAYRRHYALVEEAYRMQGYPQGSFNQRLVEVIDQLLVTPLVEEPIRLIRPEAYFLFADPDLEALTAGQKIMLRMGNENAARVKTRLSDIRGDLLSRPL